MRTYHARSFRKLGDGSIELEGVWAGVQLIALMLAFALGFLLLLRSRVLLVPGVAFALYLMVLPTRRRVVVDAKARVLIVEHAGPFQERWARRIALARVRSLRVEAAGWKAGRAVHRLIARTDDGEVYLVSVFQGEIEAGLVQGIEAVLGQG